MKVTSVFEYQFPLTHKFSDHVRPHLLSTVKEEDEDDEPGLGLNWFFRAAVEDLELTLVPERRALDVKDRIVADADPRESNEAVPRAHFPEELFEGGYQRQQESIEAQRHIHGRQFVRRSDDMKRVVVRRSRPSVVFERDSNDEIDEIRDETGWRPKLAHSRESAVKQAEERAKAELRGRVGKAEEIN
jgi:hypothetical protein